MPDTIDAEIDKVLFKIRTTKEVEHNDNQWTTEFVYGLDEAREALQALLLRERKAELESLQGCPPILVDATIKDRINELSRLSGQQSTNQEVEDE